MKVTEIINTDKEIGELEHFRYNYIKSEKNIENISVMNLQIALDFLRFKGYTVIKEPEND